MPKKTIGMIFAAGLGTRLAPFTLTAPKALVPVDGIPMLDRTINRFIAAGITDIVINVHHFAEKICDFLKSKSNFGVNIKISDETDLLLDTGGALVHAAPFFEEADSILIHNADILTDFDLEKFISYHYKFENDATLLVSERESSRYLYFNEADRLVGWKNTRTGATLPPGFRSETARDARPAAFGGVHLISTDLLPELARFSPNQVFSIIPFYAELSNSHRFMAYRPIENYHWYDIGSPEKLQEADEAARKFKI